MQVFLLKKPCDQCPFTTDIGLRHGRLKDIVDDCRDKDAPFICHKSIYETKVELEEEEEEIDDECSTRTKIEFKQHVACRGYYNANKTSPGAIIQIAQRLGFLKEVDDPTDPNDQFRGKNSVVQARAKGPNRGRPGLRKSNKQPREVPRK